MRRLTCKETTLLVSQGLDRKLSWNERLSVRLHLYVCEACARFKQQIAFLRTAMRHGAAQLDEVSTLRLPEPARARIQSALRRVPK
jgi:hypothetical protein